MAAAYRGNLHLPTAQQSWRIIFITHTHTHAHMHMHTYTHTHTHLMQNHPKMSEMAQHRSLSLSLARTLLLSAALSSNWARSHVWPQLLSACKRRERMRSAKEHDASLWWWGLTVVGRARKRSSCCEHNTQGTTCNMLPKREPQQQRAGAESSNNNNCKRNVGRFCAASASAAASATASVSASASVTMPPIGNASANREEPLQSAVRS